MSKKKLKTVEVPNNFNDPNTFGYLSPGKTYEPFDVDEVESVFYFYLKDDEDVTIFCRAIDCAHLSGLNWILHFDSDKNA